MIFLGVTMPYYFSDEIILIVGRKYVALFILDFYESQKQKQFPWKLVNTLKN